MKEARNRCNPANIEDLEILMLLLRQNDTLCSVMKPDMPFKETLRFHIITICLPREAGKDNLPYPSHSAAFYIPMVWLQTLVFYSFAFPVV